MQLTILRPMDNFKPLLFIATAEITKRCVHWASGFLIGRINQFIMSEQDNREPSNLNPSANTDNHQISHQHENQEDNHSEQVGNRETFNQHQEASNQNNQKVERMREETETEAFDQYRDVNAAEEKWEHSKEVNTGQNHQEEWGKFENHYEPSEAFEQSPIESQSVDFAQFDKEDKQGEFEFQDYNEGESGRTDKTQNDLENDVYRQEENYSEQEQSGPLQEEAEKVEVNQETHFQREPLKSEEQIEVQNQQDHAIMPEPHINEQPEPIHAVEESNNVQVQQFLQSSEPVVPQIHQSNLQPQRVASNSAPPNEPNLSSPVKPAASRPSVIQNSSILSIQQPSSPTKNSVIIIKQAERERISSTYSIFRNYNFEYQRTVNSYKLIIKNVCSQIDCRKEYKKNLHALLKDYFESYCKVNFEFHDRSYKIQLKQTSFSTNKFANIKEELKKGFEELIYLRKAVANDAHKLEKYIQTFVIKSIAQAFQRYQAQMAAQQRRQLEKSEEYFKRQKILKKLITHIDKIFKKESEGRRQKEDIFLCILKFINEQKQYRQSLINYGRTLNDLRKTYLISEKDLFTALQQILNEFKTQSRTVYSVGRKEFTLLEDYTPTIEEHSKFQNLCTITDLDYMRAVLELQNRKESLRFTNDHFLNYIELPFFDKLVGSNKILFKGAANKSFPLQQPHEELVHTISGNLVHWNRETECCKEQFAIRRLNARIIGEGVVELDELLKTMVFKESRTVRVRLRDADRAEELICYLNEKEQAGQQGSS